MMANMTPEMDRMKLAYAQAVSEVETQVNHWKNVKEDYNSVAQQLKILPDKRTRNVMVPFGPLAFMAGKLIHTNELMVHLGDCWFADVTCKQGLKIIDHRLKTVNKNLEDLDKTLQNVVKKSEFTEELDNTGKDSAIEIEEQVSKSYVHPSRRKRISRIKDKLPTPAGPPTLPADPPEPRPSEPFNDKELMKRLDELERLEEEEDQILLESGNSSTAEETPIPDQGLPSPSTKPQFNKKKRVSWKHDIIEGRDASSDDSDDAIPSIIRFKHTPEERLAKEATRKGSNVRFYNPGHIGKADKSPDISENNEAAGDGLSPSLENNPPSILKPSTSMTSQPDTSTASLPRPPFSQVALSDTVVEHAGEPAKRQDPALRQKRVSRFKASRKR